VIETWCAQPTSKRGRSIERGLVRYLTRMTTRPTPFELFAGVALATLPDHPAVRRLLERAEHAETTSALIEALVADGYDVDAARWAVDRLVDRQVLVPDLGFGVTGTSTTAFIDDLHRPARAHSDGGRAAR
jgi:hypothetical protein